jgi:hypothetical protein
MVTQAPAMASLMSSMFLTMIIVLVLRLKDVQRTPKSPAVQGRPGGLVFSSGRV